jgi:hypothetical protein
MARRKKTFFFDCTTLGNRRLRVQKILQDTGNAEVSRTMAEVRQLGKARGFLGSLKVQNGGRK